MPTPMNFLPTQSIPPWKSTPFERAAEAARNVMVSFAEHMAKTSVPVDMDRKWGRELTWLYAFPSGQFQTVCFPYLFPLLGFHA